MIPKRKFFTKATFFEAVIRKRITKIGNKHILCDDKGWGDMTIAEYLGKLKTEKNLTQQQISELSGIPMGTVSRILAGQVECPSFQAVADITKALGGSLDELAGIEPPALPIPPEAATVVRYERDQTYEDKLVSIYKKSLDDKNRWIFLLFVILLIILCGIVALLIYDFRNLDIGYIRRQMAAATSETLRLLKQP